MTPRYTHQFTTVFSNDFQICSLISCLDFISCVFLFTTLKRSLVILYYLAMLLYKVYDAACCYQCCRVCVCVRPSVCLVVTTTGALEPFNGPFSRTTRVSRYQKGKNQSGFY